MRRESAAAQCRIAIASMVGTTIEFYDFYVYATASVLVFPQLFFPRGDLVGTAVVTLVAQTIMRDTRELSLDSAPMAG